MATDDRGPQVGGYVHDGLSGELTKLRSCCGGAIPGTCMDLLSPSNICQNSYHGKLGGR